jgi:pimeloyl-ACP methyl ester carboxylesterase
MTTVLFVHGLESVARGPKALALEAAGFTVLAGKMPCSSRAVLKDPVVIAVLASAAGALLGAARAQGTGGFMIAAVLIAVLQRFVRPPLMRRTFRRSVEVQRALLASGKVDVVVGSSYGGAVAVELLRLGVWSGPTVLLAPAQRLVAARGWQKNPTLPEDASRILVVHAKQDEVVPIDHSRALVRGTNAKLIEVDDDHRLSRSATPENLKQWVELVSMR